MTLKKKCEKERKNSYSISLHYPIKCSTINIDGWKSIKKGCTCFVLQVLTSFGEVLHFQKCSLFFYLQYKGHQPLSPVILLYQKVTQLIKK